jgi:hypothetical protein
MTKGFEPGAETRARYFGIGPDSVGPAHEFGSGYKQAITAAELCGGDGSRIRRGGGGRKPIQEHDAEVSGLLEQYLQSRGHHLSEDTLQRRLRKLDYSLQANLRER